MSKGKFLKRKQLPKRAIRLLWVLIPTVALCAVLLLTVFGAFIGKGSTKGVLIGSQNYFNSNVLTSASGAANAPAYQINSSDNSETIQVMNFDPTTGDRNSFDVTYRIYCWLAETPTAQDLFVYTITIGETTYPITATSYDTAFVSQPMTLAGQHQQTDSFTVTFEPKLVENADRFADCGICVAVVPYLPDFMSDSILAGTVRKAYRGYAIQGSFQQTDTIDNMAGFIYEVLSSGVPEEGQTVTLTWDAAKLEADIRDNLMLATASVQTAEQLFPDSNLTFVEGEETTVNGFTQQWNSITFTPTEDLRYFTLSFYRVTSNDFWDTVTWSDVQSLVQLTLNTPVTP